VLFKVNGARALRIFHARHRLAYTDL